MEYHVNNFVLDSHFVIYLEDFECMLFSLYFFNLCFFCILGPNSRFQLCIAREFHSSGLFGTLYAQCWVSEHNSYLDHHSIIMTHLHVYTSLSKDLNECANLFPVWLILLHVLQGHMYLFVHHICFYSNLFGFETKVPLWTQSYCFLVGFLFGNKMLINYIRHLSSLWIMVLINMEWWLFTCRK